jgi:hypothetical protein
MTSKFIVEPYGVIVGILIGQMKNASVTECREVVCVWNAPSTHRHDTRFTRHERCADKRKLAALKTDLRDNVRNLVINLTICEVSVADEEQLTNGCGFESLNRKCVLARMAFF